MAKSLVSRNWAWRLVSGRTAYFLDYYIVPPMVAALLVWNVAALGLEALPMVALAFASGLIAWTFAEYIIHRWIFHHVWPLRPMHQFHHDHPEDLYGAPPVIGPALIFVLVYTPLAALGLAWAPAATAGMAAGYGAYIAFHYLDHINPKRFKRLLARARRRHALHHFADPNTNFGVSTSLWDHVFRTEFRGRRH